MMIFGSHPPLQPIGSKAGSFVISGGKLRSSQHWNPTCEKISRIPWKRCRASVKNMAQLMNQTLLPHQNIGLELSKRLDVVLGTFTGCKRYEFGST